MIVCGCLAEYRPQVLYGVLTQNEDPIIARYRNITDHTGMLIYPLFASNTMRDRAFRRGCLSTIVRCQHKTYCLTQRSEWMSSDILTVLTTVLSTLGIPVVMVLFYFEGLLIGKIARPAAVFILYTLVVRPTGVGLLAVILLCGMAATLGQVTLYRAFDPDHPNLIGLRQRIPYLNRSLEFITTKIGSPKLDTVTRLFERFGGIAVCISNLLPGVRCLVTIPAGVSRYPVERFVAFSLLGNILYLGGIVAITRGLVGVAQVPSWP